MTGRSEPSFTIVVPTYQRKDSVCAMVAELGRIEYAGDWGIVVVVDGSTDGTAAALRSLPGPFNLRIVELPNAGLAAARNSGARESCADILLFLDDDMFAARDLLVRHASQYARGADAVHGAIPLHEDCPDNFLTRGIARWTGTPAGGSPHGRSISPFSLYGGHFSVRRAVFEKLGGFAEGFTANGGYGSEDADFAARLLPHHVLRYNRDAVCRHRHTVGARETLARARMTGIAQVEFSRRHPRHLGELVALNDGFRASNRLIYRPLASVPPLASAFVTAVAGLSERAMNSGLRNNRWIARLFHAALKVAYWSGVRSAGGFDSAARERVSRSAR